MPRSSNVLLFAKHSKKDSFKKEQIFLTYSKFFRLEVRVLRNEPCLSHSRVSGELVHLQDELEMLPTLLPPVQHLVSHAGQLDQLVLDLVAGVVIARKQFLAKRDAVAEVVLSCVNLRLVALQQITFDSNYFLLALDIKDRLVY